MNLWTFLAFIDDARISRDWRNSNSIDYRCSIDEFSSLNTFLAFTPYSCQINPFEISIDHRIKIVSRKKSLEILVDHVMKTMNPDESI